MVEIQTNLVCISFQDKVLLLENIVAKTLKHSPDLTDGKNFESEVACIEVRVRSKHWNELFPSVLELVSNGTLTLGRIKSIHAVLIVSARILGQLDRDLLMWKHNIRFQFFGKDFPVILKSVMDHLLMSKEKDVVKV